MFVFKKLFFSLLFLITSGYVFAQYKVSFIISKLPDYHQAHQKIYIAGSFNRWNPQAKEFSLKQINNKPGITIDLPRGMIEYKFTKGSWESVEAGTDGLSVENRKITVESDTTINIEINQWADHFPNKPKQSTAGKNVHIVDTAFYIPQLNRYRRVWIYLPSSYATSGKKYPVLYMHDGQNVFDEATSFSGEWGVDEALDTLGKTNPELIVVAIDNGGDTRMNEYSPFDMEKYGKGEGDAYVDFLVNTLQPYIKKHYRTQKGGRHTYIAGSSMGGLISFYALLKYPKKFAGAGIFSPAFWITPQLKNINPHKAKKVKGKIYFFAGQKESESMVPDMLQVFEQMHRYSKAEMKTVIRAEGLHNETTWRHEFPLFYKWLFGKK